MKENELELDCCKMARRAGYIIYKGEGRVGAPDRIFTKGHYVFFVEFKKPNRKGGQSEVQKQEEKLLTDNGSSYHLCNDKDEFLKILRYHERRFQTLKE